MQNIIIDKPYKFIPPVYGSFWPGILTRGLPAYLRNSHGVESWEFIGTERLKKSIQAGHGIMLTPNHSRPCDPMVVAMMASTVGQPVHIMASWHLFMQSWFQSFILPRFGVFSMYREGMDREALKCAVQILVDARRPLIVFPEGVISRTNDRMNHLMEGTSFMARLAAKERGTRTPPGKVALHPVAIRYFFRGDVHRAIAPVLDEIERRLTWQIRSEPSDMDRIVRVGEALLTLKEIEYFGAARQGAFGGRLGALIDHLLVPLEQEWLKGKREGEVIGRVKAIRAAILPDLVAGEIAEEERTRRWRQLADLYLAQQLFFYPPDYFKPEPTPMKLLETVERFEEDLTDNVRVHRPVHVVVEVGEAIEVSAARERGAESDPLMARIWSELETMLARLKTERRPAPTDRSGP